MGDVRQTVTLPWPPKELSPNQRLHWSKVARAKKKYRADCAFVGAELQAPDGKLHAHFVFYPPTRRRIDLDNLVARMKSGIDGLADVMKVDDSQWRMSFEIAPETGGRVEVTISGL